MNTKPDIGTLAFSPPERPEANTGHTPWLWFACALSFLFLEITNLSPTGSIAYAQSATAPDSDQQSIIRTLLPLMENARNPLLEISSSEGDIYLELFPESAPQNVRRVLELSNGQLMSSATGSYYDGLTFHRAVPGLFLQTGAAERAGRLQPEPVADEINARGLGLEQQRLLDTTGKPHPWLNVADLEDFKSRVLAPLYRDMRINGPDQLAIQQQRVLERLRSMNLMQLHELTGYRYNGSLPSRRPLIGSVMMSNHGPGTNDGELLLSMVDAPWLTATHTVVGRVVSGLTLAGSISRQPEASVRIYHIRQLDTSGFNLPMNNPPSTQETNNNVPIQP